MNYTEGLYKKYKIEMEYLVDSPIMDSKIFENDEEYIMICRL